MILHATIYTERISIERSMYNDDKYESSNISLAKTCATNFPCFTL